MINEAYQSLGGYFEYLNDDCDYETWSQYLVKKIEGKGYSCGIDIGCGNGYFTRAFYKKGYVMTGFDISPSMLNKAREIALRERVKAEFICQDVKKLQLAKKVDFALAINDCINYIEKDKLDAAFKHVYNCLKKGGTFIFDVSTPEKLNSYEGFYGEDRDEVSYLWFNTHTQDSIKMELTFFVRGKDGRYDRCEETHIQYKHTQNEIVAALERVGFAVESVEGHLGDNCNNLRKNFIATKI